LAGRTFHCGFQTNVFGRPPLPRDVWRRALNVISAYGYEGVECHFRQVELLGLDAILSDLKTHNLRLAAVHYGMRLYDPALFRDEEENIRRIASACKRLNCGYIVLSGGKPRGESFTDVDVKRKADQLSHLGETALNYGVKICYHNHGWEAAGSPSHLERLRDLTDPRTVSFCLDVGNISQGGGDPVAATRRLASRMEMLHVKDFGGGGFTEIGEGEIDFPLIFDILSEAGFDGWLIVERERTNLTPEESVRRATEYLRRHIRCGE